MSTWFPISSSVVPKNYGCYSHHGFLPLPHPLQPGSAADQFPLLIKSCPLCFPLPLWFAPFPSLASGLCLQTSLAAAGYIWTPTRSSNRIISESLNLTKSQFPHLSNGDNVFAYPCPRAVKGLCEILCVKHLLRCMAHKSSIRICWYYYSPPLILQSTAA